MEEYETDYDLEEEASDQEGEEESYQEGSEENLDENPEEESEEEQLEDQPEEEAGETEADPEEATGEDPVEDLEEDPETVSGNDLVISGDVIVFPEGYDLSGLEGEQLDVEQIVQAIERQSDIMTAGFTCTCFMLGILAGALVMTGFRLRRV